MVDTDRMAGAAKDLGGRVQRAAGDLAGDPETQLRGALNQAAGTAQNLYGQAKDTVRDWADRAPDLDEVGGEARRYYREGNRAVAERVGDQHLVALLIAGAVGYALGWLLHSRR